jgi:hypothetical protein
LYGFEGEGDLLDSARLGVEPEGDRERFLFLAGSSFVALNGCGWASTGETSSAAVLPMVISGGENLFE